ncbi:MAG: S-layer y domain protein [Firmicutes bacterium]|nr:S-layer y domain protein [Bacillota bacterium]
MRKSILVVLTLLLVVSFTGTVFAANPFVDVPKDHWAYDAVKKLTHDGIITGDSSDRFNGTKPVTRYEMAKVVAKALGKADKTSAEDKALIKRLTNEFAEELKDLNVRVADLEKQVDRLHIGTAVVIKYDDRTWLANAPATQKGGRYGDTIPGFMLNTFADYKINDVWSFFVMGQLTRDVRGKTTATDNNVLVYSNDDQTKNICAKGRIGAVDVKLGRFDYNDATYATVFGDQISGVQLTFGAPPRPSGPPGGPPPSPNGVPGSKPASSDKSLDGPSSGDAVADNKKPDGLPAGGPPLMPVMSNPVLTLTAGYWGHFSMVLPPWSLSDNSWLTNNFLGTPTYYQGAEVTVPLNASSNIAATYQRLSKKSGEKGINPTEDYYGEVIPSKHWISASYDTKINDTWKFRAAYFKSSYDEKNTGYLVGVFTPMAAFFLPGSWDFSLDYIHAGANSTICQQGGWGDYTRGTKAIDLKVTYTVHPGFQWQCEYIVQRALAVDNWHDKFLRFTWSYLLF